MPGVSLSIQLWIEVNTSRRTKRREIEKETEESVRINKREEKTIKNWGNYKSKLIKYRTFLGSYVLLYKVENLNSVILDDVIGIYQ
jgi:hypothetical protein